MAPDYHVVHDHHYYSVPYTLRGEAVELRARPRTLEVFFRGHRVASHSWSAAKHHHSTHAAHLPEAHRTVFEGGASVRRWAGRVGPWTSRMVDKILKAQPFEVQGWRSAQGLRRLEQKYGGVRLEAACKKALGLGADRYKPVERILRLNRDQRPDEPEREAVPTHENVRGASFYH